MCYNIVETRTERKYNPDCMENDPSIVQDWKFRILSEDVDWTSNTMLLTVRVKVTTELTAEQVRAGLYDEYLKGCSCEHDCCGHLFGGIHDVERPYNRKKNEWILKVSYHPNY